MKSILLALAISFVIAVIVFCVIAPALQHILFWFYNAIFNKQVPL